MYISLPRCCVRSELSLPLLSLPFFLLSRMEKSDVHQLEHGQNVPGRRDDSPRDMGESNEKGLVPVHTLLEDHEIATMSEAHKEYILQRHGTLELDPMPDMNDADPYNWPNWKVGFHHCLVLRLMLTESYRKERILSLSPSTR